MFAIALRATYAEVDMFQVVTTRKITPAEVQASLNLQQKGVPLLALKHLSGIAEYFGDHRGFYRLWLLCQSLRYKRGENLWLHLTTCNKL